MNKLRNAVVFTALTLLISLGASGPVQAADDPVYTKVFSSVAVSGYDPVSYFSGTEPKKGSKKIQTEWNGAKWYFASEENKQLFIAAPEEYAPQYGGYCAWAVSRGYTASGDPTVWKIVDGKLYLNYNEAVGEEWRQDIPGNIAKADRNWPGVLD